MIYSLRLPSARIYNETMLADVGDESPLALLTVDATDDQDAKDQIIAKLSEKLGIDCTLTRDPIPPV